MLEAVRVAPDPVPIADVRQEITGEDRVLPGMRELVATCAERLALYSELDTPWAVQALAAASDT
ncbi:hypothetical protein ACFSKW_46910 [Nonomuraea mangrovi]|uniref:Uncharacterized protein n=1 Tax=Nonomuraea mangrovi TaxID=2316207 RepID=A0ABW4TAI5_9ACTN